MIADRPDGAVLSVRVIPRASRSVVAGSRDGALLVRVAAPPVDGAANDELLGVLAAALEVPRRRLSVVRGATSRVKLVQIAGVAAESLRRRLEPLLAR